MKFILDRLSGMNRAAILGFLGIVAAFGLAGFIVVARAVNTHPAQCATCHPTVTGYWQTSQSHPAGRVTCAQCHDQDVELKPNLLSYLRDIAIPEKFSAEAARIEARCIGCHDYIPEAVEEEDKLIRVNHKAHLEKPLEMAGGAVELRCLDCHDTVAHDYSPQPTNRPTMEGCFAGSCHQEDRNADNCRRCHYQQLVEVEGLK